MPFADTIPFALGQSQTGLRATLRAAIVDTAGVPDATARDIATGFAEFGRGTYQWYYASYPDGFTGGIVVYTGTLSSATDFAGVTVLAVGEPDEPASAPTGVGPNAMVIHVRDATSLAAVVGASVAARGNQAADAVTDASGDAVLNLAAGAVNILATAPGYANSAVRAETVIGGEWVSSGTGTLVVGMVAESSTVEIDVTQGT